MIILQRLTVLAFCCAYVTGADYSPEEEKCIVQQKLYHKPTKQCYEVLSKGPCPPGQWFVLQKPRNDNDKDILIKGVCIEDKCGESKFYWPDEDKCVGKEEKDRLCKGSKEYLGTNDFGEGDCICVKTPAHVRFPAEDGKCVPLLNRGPCEFGKVVGYESLESLHPTCLVDPCHAESIRRKNSGELPRKAVLAMYNGTCYPLNERGPCPKEQIFQASQYSSQPLCATLSNAIFNLANAEDCVEDEAGSCLQPVYVSQDKDAFKRRQLAALQAQRRKKYEAFEIVADVVAEEEADWIEGHHTDEYGNIFFRSLKMAYHA